MTFIDTGAFLARYLPADQHHKTATLLWNKIRASYSFAAEKARIIYASNALEILRPDSLTELAALN